MFYPKKTVCQTCGNVLDKKISEYKNGTENIYSNPKLSIEEKQTELSKLLLSLGLRRYCCKMRMNK